MRPSKKSLSLLETRLSTAELAALVGLSEDWIRQLRRAGVISKESDGRFDTGKAVAAIVQHYREKQNDLKGVKKALVDEQHRKLKFANDATAGLMVERALVVSEFRKVVEPIKAIIRQKLENELPIAMAGLSIPEARIFGKRLGDSLLIEWQKIFDTFKA